MMMHFFKQRRGHNWCQAMPFWLINISIQIIAINLILKAQAIPQQQQQQQHDQELKAKTSQYQEPNIALNAPNQTADLSLLINETLAINNKTLSNSDKTILKDDWTFDMIEYDLMEFLQDLSARYKQSNKTLMESDGNPLGSAEESLLEAKRDIKEATNVSSSPESVVAKTSNTQDIEKGNSEKLTVNKPPHGTPPKFHPTNIPLMSTSLASGDPEIAESSWQYGIFDRFTRPKSTTKAPTTPNTDSLYDSETAQRLDVRQFNSDECGLRTYSLEEQPLFYPPDQLDGPPDEIQIQTINRQRLPGERKKTVQLTAGSILDLIKDRGDSLISGASGDKKPSLLDQWEGLSLDENISSSSGSSNSNKQEGSLNDSQLAPSAEGVNFAESDFNLASRRHWLQQQLGSTLQMLAFNSTPANQSVSDLFVNQTGYNSNFRENMMKASGKWGKSADLQPLVQSDQKLAARQDELKLEARVIGGSGARLGDSPWSVSLQALVSRPGTGGVEYRHYCGGTIISEYYVLTAAHCLDFMVGRESRLFVVVGDLNWRMSTTSLHGRRFGIEKLIIHSGYKSTAFGHDIGLIRTKESMKPLKVNGKYIVNSVCLPQKGVEHSGEAELVGWGLFSNRNEMADSLQIADVPILPRPLCVDLYKRRTGLIQWLIGIELITEKQVCAGTFGRGICQGDSGSALVVNERSHHSQQVRRRVTSSKGLRDRTEMRQTKATIIGIVAFGGIRRCSYQSLPGVYMQTSKYMDWILPRIQS